MIVTADASALTPVTTPVESTRATSGLEDSHVTCRPAGLTVAVSFTVWLALTVAVFGATTTVTPPGIPSHFLYGDPPMRGDGTHSKVTVLALTDPRSS